MGKTAAGSSAGSVDDALDPFLDQLASAGEAAAAESAGDPKVIVAVQIGWLMREVIEGWLPEVLVSGLTLDDAEKRGLQGLQLTTLLGSLKLAGLAAGDVKTVTNALQSGPARAPAGALEPKLVVAMVGADARLGKAYVLGGGLRALMPAATGLTDAPDTKALVGALDALSSALPSHAARAVGNSLAQWSQSKATLTESQVGLWRSVIVGEKKGTELLEPDDYLDAARELEGRFARRALTSPWLWAIALLAVALFGAGIYFLLAAHGQAGKVATGASGVLAALGLTWKGIGGTLGKFVGKLEAPLWGAELDAAITYAITLSEPPRTKPARGLLPRPKPAAGTRGLGYADRRGRAV
jgi:hypothetical protein